MTILEVFDLLNVSSAGPPVDGAITCLALSLASRWFGHDAPTGIAAASPHRDPALTAELAMTRPDHRL